MTGSVMRERTVSLEDRIGFEASSLSGLELGLVLGLRSEAWSQQGLAQLVLENTNVEVF